VLDSVSGRRRIPTRDTAPHASKLANESRSGERYPARCRTDRCRWAASSLTAPAPTLISIRRESHRSRLGEQPGAKRSGDRAAALRPPDLVSITRGLGPATFCSVVAFLDPEPAAAVAGERGRRAEMSAGPAPHRAADSSGQRETGGPIAQTAMRAP
jgi:hypothetical protein